MGATRVPWPQRTTLLAGVLVLLTGTAEVLLALRLDLPLLETVSVPLYGEGLGIAARLGWCGALVVLAVGMPGEAGAAGRSRLGQVTLIVWGAVPLVLELLPVPQPPGPEVVLVGLGLHLAGLVAGVVASVAVLRARVLDRPCSWLLAALAALGVAVEVLQLTPAILLVAGLLQAADPAVRLLLGVALLLHGRFEAVRHRGAVIREHW